MGVSLGVKRVKQEIRVTIVKIISLSRNCLELLVLEVPSLDGVNISTFCRPLFCSFCNRKF